TDGNLQTSDTLSNGEVIIDLASPVRVSGFRFTKVGGSSNRIDIKGVKKIGLKNMSNGDYFTLAEVNLYEYESVPPSDITDLKENIKHDSVEFTYKNPKSNFSHLRIYRDGQVLASDVKEEKFTDKGLTPETEHIYKFVSVSPDGLESKGIEKKIKTAKEPLPDEIKDLQEDE
ncbi:fibronectin type III domain-containing protein, partial [Bacillus cereus]|nr:fibronectin type III domain-containing protein [Bacillus cereus]